MAWVREGSCPPERCKGRCCRHIAMWMDATTDDLQWVKTRGLTSYEMGSRLLIDFPSVCPHLTDTGLCALFGQPSRPKNCDDWPTDPSQTLLDDCGFTFRHVDERELAHG